MTENSSRFAERHPFLLLLWISFKIAVLIAVFFFLSKDEHATILYQRF